MRSAITLYALHGERALRVLTDGQTPLEEQQANFKKLAQDREHEDWERIELWTSSGGCVKSHKFRLPAAKEKTKPEPKKSEPKKPEPIDPKDDAESLKLAAQSAGSNPPAPATTSQPPAKGKGKAAAAEK